MSANHTRVDRLRPPDDFRKVFALGTQTVLAMVAIVVISRRMSGAFHGPVHAAVPCLVATLAAILSLAGMALWKAATPTASTQNRLFAAALAVVPPVVLGAALWISPSAFVGGYLAALATACVLSVVAAEDRAIAFFALNTLQFARVETSSLTRDGRASVDSPKPFEERATTSSQIADASQPQDSEPDAAPNVTLEAPSSGDSVLSVTDDEGEFVQGDEADADQSIVQWMTRRRLADGGELIEGAVQIEFTATEKVGVAHLAFSPPLGCDPRAECHLLSNFDGRVRITIAKSYGLRIEARLSGEAASAGTINVAFTAEAPPAASHAAAA